MDFVGSPWYFIIGGLLLVGLVLLVVLLAVLMLVLLNRSDRR